MSNQDRREPRWPAALALVVASALYVVLPGELIIGPRWLIPGLEVALVITLLIHNANRMDKDEPRWRALAIAVIALINVANVISVILLVRALIYGNPVNGRTLVYSAIAVWLTNAIIFGVWFWELDRGGPGVRGTSRQRWPDFQFPQMANPDTARSGWRPTLPDYLYVGFTNATAFSPTDAMPLSVAAKSLMTAESLVSMVTVVVVAARAVNILK
ncbi:MAG TPA: hypothetical protein VKG43_04940 [Acidimicrobiales bacterium]|nr:hypothetical protein [Acidimicrobiales bacterium]